MVIGFRGCASVAVAVVLLGAGAPASLLASSDLGAYWSLLERQSDPRGMLDRVLNALDTGEEQPPSRPTQPVWSRQCPGGGHGWGAAPRARPWGFSASG